MDHPVEPGGDDHGGLAVHAISVYPHRAVEERLMKIIVTDQAGEVHELEGLEGWRVMEVIRDWGLNIKAECGGALSCATCHCYVDGEWLDVVGAPSDDEEDMLDSVGDVKSNSRLSCQILCSDALDGLKLTLAPSAAKD